MRAPYWHEAMRADAPAYVVWAATDLWRKFHVETDCGKDGLHWAECAALADVLGLAWPPPPTRSNEQKGTTDGDV